LCENKIFKEEESKKSPGSITKQNATRWVVVFFIGVCTALIACTIDICVVEMTKIKYGFLKKCKMAVGETGAMWDMGLHGTSQF
jgi:chloride channel 7